MNSRRNILVATVVLVAIIAVNRTHAEPIQYGVSDKNWYADGTFRQGIADKFKSFVGAAQHPLPLVGYEEDPSQINSIADQFLIGFLGVPGQIQKLPSGHWLFFGAVPHLTDYVSFVAMSPDQTRIEAAMMSYSLCPKEGVKYVDPVGGQHLLPCEEDPGWVIFVSRYDARNDALIESLSQVALKYRLAEQRSMIIKNIRSKKEINAKTEVIQVP